MDSPPKTPTCTRQSSGTEGLLDGMKSKLLSRSQLKSNIPRPVPYVRTPRELRSKSCSSSFKRYASSLSTVTESKMRSTSLTSPSLEHQKPTNITTQSKKYAVRPQSARSQYSNVKAKIDNKTPVSLLLKRQDTCPNDCLMQRNSSLGAERNKGREISLVNKTYIDGSLTGEKSKDSTVVEGKVKVPYVEDKDKNSPIVEDTEVDSSLTDEKGKDSFLFDDKSEDARHGCKASSIVEYTSERSDLIEGLSKEFLEESPRDQISSRNSTTLLGKEISAYTRSDGHQSSSNLSVPEAKIHGVLRKKYGFKHKEDVEGTPEFLSSFEKQMKEISELWLQLICDLIVTKMTIGKSVLPQLSLCNSDTSWREEITKFFQKLPTQGEILLRKLCKIEEEQMNALRVVIYNVLAVIKEQVEMKGKESKLEETYEQTKSKLMEELAILSQENKELDQKYAVLLEKYELEKSKTEELEEHLIEILKKMFELRKVLKHNESRCTELEKRVESIYASRIKIEENIKNLETAHEKESKKYDAFAKKHEESEKLISKLKQEIKKGKNSKAFLEVNVKELQNEITEIRAALQSSLQKSTELENEVSSKNNTMKKLEIEINSLKSKKKDSDEKEKPSSDELVKDLVNNVEKRNLQIQELRKKINRLENMLREKSNREEKLMSHVTKLNKKCNINCTSLTNQIIELQRTVKGLLSQVSELEKVLGQKTLQLEQRDRLNREFKELLQLKHVSDPLEIKTSRQVKDKLLSIEADKEAISRHEKMVEMFSLLEHKQMEIMKLERRLWGLKKIHGHKESTGEKHEQQKNNIDGALD